MAREIIQDPNQHIGKLCHVEGWPPGCVFRLVRVEGEHKILETPRTGRIYRVRNNITLTKRQEKLTTPPGKEIL